jgi:hypothetical protein
LGEDNKVIVLWDISLEAVVLAHEADKLTRGTINSHHARRRLLDFYHLFVQYFPMPKSLEILNDIEIQYAKRIDLADAAHVTSVKQLFKPSFQHPDDRVPLQAEV